MELHYRQEPNGRYILGKGDIDRIADQALQEFFPENLEYAVPLNTDRFFDKLGLMVKHEFLGLPDHMILGATIMGDVEEIPGCDILFRPVVFEECYGTVLINSSLCCTAQEHRKRYTEAHEISHWLLHRPYFERLSQTSQPCHVACRVVERYQPKLRTENDWLEWQADSLAAALLMPRDTFYGFAKAAIKAAGVYRGYLIEGQSSDRAAYKEAIRPITKRYLVSNRAAQIRMIELGLIKKHT